jgi:hypothetical protein
MSGGSTFFFLQITVALPYSPGVQREIFFFEDKVCKEIARVSSQVWVLAQHHVRWPKQVVHKHPAQSALVTTSSRWWAGPGDFFSFFIFPILFSYSYLFLPFPLCFCFLPIHEHFIRNLWKIILKCTNIFSKMNYSNPWTIIFSHMDIFLICTFIFEPHVHVFELYGYFSSTF